MDLATVKERMGKLSADISKAEGAKAAVEADIKKEFGVENIDQAYDQYDDLKDKVEKNKAEKEKLISATDKKLTEYGY